MIGSCLDGGVGAAGWRARTLRYLQVWAGRTVPLSFCLPESAVFVLGRTRVISLVLPPFRGGCVRAPPKDPTQAWSATLVAFRSEASSGDGVMPCVSPTSKPVSFQNISFCTFQRYPAATTCPQARFPVEMAPCTCVGGNSGCAGNGGACSSGCTAKSFSRPFIVFTSGGPSRQLQSVTLLAKRPSKPWRPAWRRGGPGWNSRASERGSLGQCWAAACFLHNSLLFLEAGC